MAEETFDTGLMSLEQQESTDTYYVPKLKQTIEAGEYASERDVEIKALKKMAGKNNNAFIMGMRNLDEQISPALFDGYLERKAKERGIPMKSSGWEATKGAVEGVVKAPARYAGHFATRLFPLIAKSAVSAYALSGAAGGPESADKWAREMNKGIESFNNEMKRITGIDDASMIENLVAGSIADVSSGILLRGFAAPSFGLSAGMETYARQREKGTDMGESFSRALWHGTGEAALEKLQLNRIMGSLAKRSRPIKMLIDVIENASQEGLQQSNELAANWNIDDRGWVEKIQEVLLSMAGGAVASIAGSVGGVVLDKRTIKDVSNMMEKAGRSEQEIQAVKESLNKIVDSDELQQAANQVAKDELTTVALTYKEQAQAASEELVNQLDKTITRNELVDTGSALAGQPEGMPPLYQLGDLEVDTQKNPSLGMVLYQAEQEGKPFQTLGQVIEWTQGKLNTERAKQLSTGIGSVYSQTYEQLKGLGQDETLADMNARIRSSMAFAIANKYGGTIEDANKALGGVMSMKASEFEGIAPKEVQEAVTEKVVENVEQNVQNEAENKPEQETSLAEAVSESVQEVAKTNKEVAEATQPTEKIEDYGEVLEGAKKNLEKTEEDTGAKKTALEKIMSKVSETRDERIVVVNWLQQQDQEFIELLAKLNRPVSAWKTQEYKDALYDLYDKHPEVKEEKPRWQVAYGNEELSKETLEKYGIKPSYRFMIEKKKRYFVDATKENIEEILGNRGKITFTFASSNRGDYYLWVKKGSQGWKPLMKFDSKEDAEKYKESHTEQELMDLYKEKSTVVENKEKVIRKRKGEDYRKGKDVTAEDFANTFGFRGVQFGNYEKNEKRQRELNNAYDSLMDLANIVGIPPKAISLEGQLGIAFGARGSGNAAAHYERNNKVINITRDSGAGAIGHEWFHALDNYFGGGMKMATANGSYVERGAMRQELRSKLVDFLYAIETEKSFNERLRFLGDYWKKKWEIGARVFEQYLVDKMEKQGIVNDYLATEKTSSPYLTKEEQADILPKLDDFFKTMKYEEVEGKYRLFQESMDIADENARLDDIYPEYEGDTIDINGVQKTVYNSEGNRIAKSAEALRNFYRWFGNSKVVDDKGRPLVVYHGTDAVFDRFDIGKIKNTALGEGFYFGSNKMAKGYTKTDRVMPVYLIIENFVDPTDESNVISAEQVQEIADRFADMYIETDSTAKLFFDYVNYSKSILGQHNTRETIDFMIDFSLYGDKDVYKHEMIESINNMIKDVTGIDGYESGGVYVVFNPNQIKSTDNKGTYEESPYIHLQEQGGIPRGAYYNNTVYLFENANESTFVHEMSHAYMDVLTNLANNGNQQAQRDLEVIRKWLGKKQGEAFTQADWERFARGFEMYLREGKAPNEYLGGKGGVFESFKNWLLNIYAGIKSLAVTNEKGQKEPVRINNQIKQFYDEMLGGTDIDSVIQNAQQNEQAMQTLQNKLQELSDIQQRLAEERAKLVREMANNVKPETTWANVKDWGKNLWESARELPSGVLQSSYERLAKIDKRLGLLVQRAEQSQGLRIKRWTDQIKPFYEAFNNLSNEDKAKVQFYLLNQQWGEVEDLIGQDATNAVRDMLKTIYDELIESGVEVGYRENYFPRSVLDYDGLLQEMGLTYPSLRKEMEEAIGKDATPEEQAEWLDNHIMGFSGGNVSTKGNKYTKERKLDLITTGMAQYYKPSMETLVNYVEGMAKLLSMREAFGKDIEAKEKAEDSIGKIINNMLGDKKLTKKEIDEVRHVLSALYLPNGMGNKFLQAMRQYGYATKLSYSTTIRQFADIGMMMKVNGVLNTLDALFHPDKRITLENLGIDPLGEEFNTSKKDFGGKIANFSTKWKGINWADAIMKNAFMRGSYKSLQELAKTPDKFNEKYDSLFGDETDTLIKDLNDNKVSEPVKVLLFHEISKIQPISRSAMPTAYLMNPNGRVFYMFKTFSLHRAEYMVSELANDFRNGDFKKAGKDIMADVAVIGWEGLVELLIAFLKYGWQAFAAKEVLDTFAGAGLGVLGLNKHQALQLTRGQVGDFFQEMVGVGTPLDDIGYMIRHAEDPDKLIRAFLPDMIVEPLLVGPKPISNKKTKVK